MSLLYSFIIKEYILMKRYIINSLAGGITLYIIFFIIFQGISSVSGGNLLGDTIESIIVGYIVWIMAISSFQDITLTIQDEKKQGTIGQLFMAKYNLIRLLLTKVFAQFILNFILIGFMLVLLMVTTKYYLHFKVLEVLIILLIINLNYWGIGFFFGGLSLLYKKTESILQIMQFAFMALIISPIEVGVIKYLPSTWGIEVLKRVVNNSNYILGSEDIILLVLSSLSYFGLGMISFYFSKKKAIRKGIVEHY